MSLKRFKGWIIDEPYLYVKSNMPSFFEHTWVLHFVNIIVKELVTHYNALKSLNEKLYERILYAPQVKKLQTYFLLFFTRKGESVNSVVITNEKGVGVLYSNTFYSNTRYCYPTLSYGSSKTVVITCNYTVNEPSAKIKKMFSTFAKNNILIDKKIKIVYGKV